MANTNVLEGMACPICGSEGPFEIAFDAVYLVDDEGTQQQLSDSEWDGGSYCGCRQCSHSATVCEFRIEEQTDAEYVDMGCGVLLKNDTSESKS